jgi:hypothetical protein
MSRDFQFPGNGNMQLSLQNLDLLLNVQKTTLFPSPKEILDHSHGLEKRRN